MTVSELEAFLNVTGKEMLQPCDVRDLIADWRAMRDALINIINTDSDKAWRECQATVRALRLNP